jgi:putative MATE family efflux protein
MTRPEASADGPGGPAIARPAPAAVGMPAASGATSGRFTQGPTMRHVLVMSLTSGVGLIAIFLVDFLSLMYVSWLGATEKTAAVSFASIVLFFMMSTNIALMIAISAVTSKALGAGNRAEARRLAGSGTVLAFMAGFAFAIIMLPFIDVALAGLGAKGETAAIARLYLLIVIPTNPLMALGMAYSAILRAAADARRAMWVTLSGGLATAIFDPILIFALRLDVAGAAISIVLARLTYIAVGHNGAAVKRNLVARPTFAAFATDLAPLARIAVPAMLTNLATPAANAIMARVMAGFGVGAVAAFGVIDRVVPLAFGGLFALSGAIGPVLGQNWGAHLYPRMHRILNDALICTFVYVGAMWLLLVLARDGVVGTFQLSSQAAEIVRFFCLVSGPAWIGIGLLFCANSAFNNLGFPLRATILNWGRATFGTLPFALIGAVYGGPQGVIAATLAAGACFGIGSMILAHASVRALARRG